MNKMKTTLENLLRKSVGLSPKGVECCEALPRNTESEHSIFIAAGSKPVSKRRT